MLVHPLIPSSICHLQFWAKERVKNGSHTSWNFDPQNQSVSLCVHIQQPICRKVSILKYSFKHLVKKVQHIGHNLVNKVHSSLMPMIIIPDCWM